MKGTSRALTAALLVLVALLAQISVLPQLGWPDAGRGAVPSLVLLVVVLTALATDTRFGMLTGFVAGLLLDVVPPADHLAGRWALALLVVGYVVGRVSHDHQSDLGRGARPGLPLILGAVAGGSFLGNSVFALSGLVLHDLDLGVGALLRTVALGVVCDVVAALIVAPVVLWIYRRAAGESPRLMARTAR